MTNHAEGIPRWVKLVGLVVLILVLLVLVMLVVGGGGGQHGPRRHSSGDTPRVGAAAGPPANIPADDTPLAGVPTQS